MSRVITNEIESVSLFLKTEYIQEFWNTQSVSPWKTELE